MFFTELCNIIPDIIVQSGMGRFEHIKTVLEHALPNPGAFIVKKNYDLRVEWGLQFNLL